MKKFINHKSGFVAIAVLLMGIVGVTATFGLLWTKTNAIDNQIGTGEVTTHIEEDVDDGTPRAGMTLKKSVSVVSTDSDGTGEGDGIDDAVAAFVRVRITVTPEYLLNSQPDGITLLCGSWSADSFTGTENVLGDTAGTLYDFQGVEGVGWIYGGDGYYYYNQVLQPYETTESIFDAVKIGTEAAENFDITVYQEAVNYHGYAKLFENGVYVGGEVNQKTYSDSNEGLLAAMQDAFAEVTK